VDKYKFSDEAARILENLDVPFVIYQSISNRIVTILATNGFCDLIGLSRADAIKLLDTDMYRGTHPEDKAFVAELGIKFAAGTSEYDCVYRSWSPRLEDYGIVHAVGRHIIMEDGTPLLLVYYMDESSHSEGKSDDFTDDIREVFAHMISNKMPVLNSYYDILTGLPNMAYFFELAEAGCKEIVKHGETPTILSFDLNGMKDFNSQHGIEEGNKLLCALADILREEYTNENCARFGEDHFYVFTSDKGVEEGIQRVFDALEHANEGHVLPLRVGVYIDEYNVANMGAACDRAKMACDYDRNTYFSKIVYFDKNMLRQSAVREYVLNYIDIALEERWIVPYFQPIVRAINGKVTEEEAYARWIDPKRGIFSPADFIPVLEESKLMYKLDLYMVDRVIDAFEVKKHSGLKIVPVSINISRYDFECIDMVSEIVRRLDEREISHELLKIEITETVIGFDSELLNQQIERFHKAGIEVWMDNFGAGYSSLNVLQDFDFDAIKLDTAFMKNFNQNGKNYPIILGLIRMAKNMGIRVIAQGVETEDQERLLRAVGCDNLQGYYYFMPVSIKKIIELMQSVGGKLRETDIENEYYTRISELNLNRLDISGDSEIEEAIRSRIYGAPIAVVEYGSGDLRMIRCNEAYQNYLRKFGLTSKDGFIYDEREPFSRTVRKAFEEVVDDAGPDRWTALGVQKDYVLSTGFIRKLCTNVESGKSAFVIIIPIY
jgi:diguanylate cyclase (GGDEF)-like protein